MSFINPIIFSPPEEVPLGSVTFPEIKEYNFTELDFTAKKVKKLASKCEICDVTERFMHNYKYREVIHKLCSRHYKWFVEQRKVNGFEVLRWEDIVKAKKEIDLHYPKRTGGIKKFREWLRSQGIESSPPPIKPCPEELKTLVRQALVHYPRKNTPLSERCWKNWKCLNCGSNKTSHKSKGPKNINDFCSPCGTAWKKFMEAEDLEKGQREQRNKILKYMQNGEMATEELPPSKKIKIEDRMGISFLTTNSFPFF